MTPTTDQLYEYANRYAAGFRAGAIEPGKAGDFPTVAQCARRFRCRQSDIEAVADEGDPDGGGYLGVATYNVSPIPAIGEWIVEAYGRPDDDVDLEDIVPCPEPEVGP